MPLLLEKFKYYEPDLDKDKLILDQLRKRPLTYLDLESSLPLINPEELLYRLSLLVRNKKVSKLYNGHIWYKVHKIYQKTPIKQEHDPVITQFVNVNGKLINVKSLE